MLTVYIYKYTFKCILGVRRNKKNYSQYTYTPFYIIIYSGFNDVCLFVPQKRLRLIFKGKGYNVADHILN